MRKMQWLTTAILIGTISGAPQFAAAMGESSPTPPQTSQPSGTTTTKHKAKKEKSGSAEDFLTRYHAAYALIYDKGDYEAGIAALREMGFDDNAASSAAMTTPNIGTTRRSWRIQITP
jgi:hypothetical protein